MSGPRGGAERAAPPGLDRAVPVARGRGGRRKGSPGPASFPGRERIPGKVSGRDGPAGGGSPGGNQVKKKRVDLYDTTLRDGSQAEKVSFSLEDKLRYARKMDEFGIHYLEGGWPGSNPKDEAFFQAAGKIKFQALTLAAFGSTHRAGVSPGDDANTRKLLESGCPVITIFGKSWLLHVEKVLRITADENLAIIRSSVDFLRGAGRRVFFDAEHFFDGYRENPGYALQCLEAAADAGAEILVLCDSNGGSLPAFVSEACAEVARRLKTPFGIHAHNDGGLAVANSVAAVEAGATQVQGTLNGLGERCGNADLLVVAPVLGLKMGRECLSAQQLRHLTNVSRYVYELTNLAPANNQPFVGASAFAHKGGIHVDAMMKDSRAYEHLDPRLVGNERRILVSELSGGATILNKIGAWGISRKGEETRRILERVTALEKEGFQFEAAEGSFDLLVARELGRMPVFFEIVDFRAMVEKKRGLLISEGSVKVRVGEEQEYSIAEGDGPVNALDAALRKALARFYPSLSELRLTDYKVRVLNPEAATAASVRVLVESADGETAWGTVGLSENIIEASMSALADSFNFKLLKDSRGDERPDAGRGT